MIILANLFVLGLLQAAHNYKRGLAILVTVSIL